MTRSASHALAILVLAVVASAGCRSTAQPGDPMLDAIRAKERSGDLSYAESQGRNLFVQYCTTCHGDEGHGDGQNASNLDPAPPDLNAPNSGRDAAYLTTVISQGSIAVGRSPLSPPWGRSLTHQQIAYLVVYCQALGRRKPT